MVYPKKLTKARELEFASRAERSIEINGLIYSLQRPTSYAVWYDAAPPNLVFSVKSNRYITHILRLRDLEKPLGIGFASGVFNLHEELGPFLWQFPPSFRSKPEQLEFFLSLLPRYTEQALQLARKGEPHREERMSLAIDQNRKLGHAMEMRASST